MREDDLLEPAAVQYGDWSGTVSGDDVDMRDVCEFLGIDRSDRRVLAMDVTIYGGHQRMTAYGVPADQGWVELEATRDRGEPIRCRVPAEIEFDAAAQFDPTPPPPLSVPVVSPTSVWATGSSGVRSAPSRATCRRGSRLICEHPEEGDEGFRASEG